MRHYFRAGRVVASILLAAAVLCAPAGAATMKLFKGPTYQYFSPLVAYNPDADNFLVVGYEGNGLKSRRSGLQGGGKGFWTLAPQSLGDWYSQPTLAYNSRARSYLVADRSYVRLNRRGVVVDEDFFPGSFDPNALALTAMGGTGRWFAWLEDCKYGCGYYGQIIKPGGGLTVPILLSLSAMEDHYANERKWVVGYNSDEETLLLVWEDRLDRNYEGPSRAIRGQRYKRNGRTVGDAIKIAKHKRDASQPHIFSHPKRSEWLIVYRRNSRVKARFLRDGGFSKPVTMSGSRPASVPSIAYSTRRDTYLVTWVQEGDGAGIYGRWLRADGSLIGRAFVVNDKAGDQYVSEAGNSACNDSGSCLVTWINGGEDGTTRGRYLRVP